MLSSMAGGRGAAAVLTLLLVAHLVVPIAKAAVPKAKPKVTWKKLSRNVQWQWQLDDNGVISKIKV